MGDKPQSHSDPVTMRLPLLLLAALLLWPAAVMAQALPNHVDPSARDLVAATSRRCRRSASSPPRDFPPFNYRDTTGELIGFNIDLARAICAELNVACTIQAWPWEQAAERPRRQPGRRADRRSRDDARERRAVRFLLDLPDAARPLRRPGRGRPRVSIRRRSTGTTVSVRRGTTHAEFVRRYLPGAKLVEFDTEIEALEAVRDGTADAYFGDAMRASFWLNANVGCCDFAGDALLPPGPLRRGPCDRGRRRTRRRAPGDRLSRSSACTTPARMDELYLRWFPVSFY